MKNDNGFHDLGEELCCSPEPTTEEKEMTHYPSLYFSGKQADAFKGLPQEGEAVIRFKKVSETERTDRKGEKSYSVELQIHAIKAGKASKVSDDTEEEAEEVESPMKKSQSDEDAIELGLEAAAKAEKE